MDFKVINFFSKNKEFINFNTNLTDQLSVINSIRWSYRYSNLHRRSIYNSHKLTESKKLLSSGFFDINITNESLWFSDKYARPLESKKERKSLSPKDLISSNWKVLYNTTFNNTSLQDTLSTPFISNNYNSLIKLSFYESSFHFFLKRLNSFNNLFSNKITSSPQNNNLNSLNLSNNNLSSTKGIYNITLNNELGIKSTLYKESLNYTKNSSNINKDLILVQRPGYFLTKKKVDILYNITKYSPSTGFNLKYFINLNLNKMPYKVLKPFKLKQFKKNIKI
jgi:hypothetical protein